MRTRGVRAGACEPAYERAGLCIKPVCVCVCVGVRARRCVGMPSDADEQLRLMRVALDALRQQVERGVRLVEPKVHLK